MRNFIILKKYTLQNYPKQFHFCKSSLIVFGFIMLCFMSGCATHLSGKAILSANSCFSENAYADTSVLTEKSGLDEYLRFALLNNPELRAAYYKFRSAYERAYLSGVLSEPQLSYEYFIQGVNSRYNISLTQMVPGWDKLELERKRGYTEAMSALYGVDAERLRVIRRVGEAFYEYFYLRNAIEVMHRNHQVLIGLEESLKKQYLVGSISFSMLTKLRIERDEILSELKALNDKRSVLSANFASVLNIPTNYILPFYDGELPKLTSLISVDQNQLVELAVKTSPEVKMFQAMLDGAGYMVEIAKRRFLPDLMLGMSFMAMPDMSEKKSRDYDASIMLGMTLPLWWQKNFAAVRDAQAVLQAKQSEYTNLLNSINLELNMRIFDFRDSERRINLIRDRLIPETKQIYEVSNKDFMSGKIDFMGLMDAYRTLLNLELMLERAKVDHELALLRIYSLVGLEQLNVIQKSRGNE